MPWDARPGKAFQIPLWPRETVAPNHPPSSLGPNSPRSKFDSSSRVSPRPARYALCDGLIEVGRHLSFYLHMRRYARADARADVRRVRGRLFQMKITSINPHLNVFQLPSTHQPGAHRSPAASAYIRGYIRGFPRKQWLVSRVSLGGEFCFHLNGCLSLPWGCCA